MLFDTHAHYNDCRFNEDRDDVLNSMEENGIGFIMNACCSVEEIPEIIALCEKYPFIYGSIGIYPEVCTDNTSEKDIEIMKKYASHPKIKAVGEIGLDYHSEGYNKELQKKWFSRQIELANELKFPIMIHDRDAHGDVMDILRAIKPKRGGVFHCYAGSVEMAREIMNMDMYIAFGGTLTFKNSRRAKEVAQYVPVERMVIETDSPYLTPHPQRGRRNDSRYIHLVADKIAEIKNMSYEEVSEILTKNSKKLYGV